MIKPKEMGRYIHVAMSSGLTFDLNEKEDKTIQHFLKKKKLREFLLITLYYTILLNF